MTADKLAGRKTLAVEGFLEEFEKDEIKARVNILLLFESFHVKLSPKGKGFIGKCPWHPDKQPSLSVDRDKGLYHCFGCGESGDVVSLVQKVKGVGFRAAMAYLKAQAGRLSPGKSSAPAERRRPGSSAAQPAASQTSSAAVSLLLDEVAAHYARALAAEQKAQAYLATRALDDGELLSTFKLGYCRGDLSKALSATQRAALLELGLLRASGGEHFAGCITVPLWDEDGQVAGFYGRRITANSGAAHLYLPGPHRGLVNRGAARVFPEQIILPESVLDALSLFRLGIPNVIPCYGTGGFTEEHEKLLREQRVKIAVIGFDSDEAGRRGAQELAARLAAWGIVVKLLFPPQGKDWNEYLVAGGNGEAVKALLASATPLAPASGAAAEGELRVSTERDRKLFTIGEVRYRVAGMRELFASSLRVNIRSETAGRRYIDNVDLCSARSRASFASSMADLLGLEPARVERDLVRMLEHLEAERDRRLAVLEAVEPQAMSEEERAVGMSFLQDPNLLEGVLSDLEELGYVGEEENKLLVYLAATSRLLPDPLSVLLVSESASGKSFLIECVQRLLPPEEVVAMTSLSDQALQYLGEQALLHKFLARGEAVHSEAVEHQIREMLSSRELSRLVTLKDEKTGELSSRLVRKPVVVSCALSTTNPQVNPENASRFFVVGADESEAQTRAILARQRGKYSLKRYQQGEQAVEAIQRRHRAAQRLLTPRIIVNPFAPCLEFPSRLLRARRDHQRFLDLIACVCFLRQHLKEEREQEGIRFIECDLLDYRWAYRVMQKAISWTYASLPPQALALYEAARALARTKAQEQGVGAEEVAVSQREIREATGMNAMTVKRMMRLLVDWEYVSLEGSRRRGCRRGYRLLRDEEAGELGASRIPSPEEVEGKLHSLESGSSGSEWVRSGSDPVLEA